MHLRSCVAAVSIPQRRQNKQYFYGEVASLGVVHDALHVVARKQARDAVAHAFEPAVVVLLDDVNDGALHERQLVLFVPGVVVDGHHCEDTEDVGSETTPRTLSSTTRCSSFEANLSPRRSWGPTAGPRRRTGRCTARQRRPPLRSPREEAAAAETRQTWASRPEVEEEVELECLQLFNQKSEVREQHFCSVWIHFVRMRTAAGPCRSTNNTNMQRNVVSRLQDTKVK